MLCEIYRHTKFAKYLDLGEEENLWHQHITGVRYEYVPYKIVVLPLSQNDYPTPWSFMSQS